MCEAGRVVHHIANATDDPRNMILIVGYQAENTLGRKLVEKHSSINIFGEPHDLRAEVVVLNSFSAHADRNELLGYLGRFDRKALRRIFIVHGDPDQSEKLQGGLESAGFSNTAVPTRGERVKV
jgi:metallo-beta-lactamase family protein